MVQFPSQVITKALKKVTTNSLLDAHRKRDSVEEKTTSLLFVFLGKALNGAPPILSDRKVVRSCIQPFAGSKNNESMNLYK